jgi:hypothetical protein
MCGSTSAWSPRLPAGGKTATRASSARLKRSPATTKRWVAENGGCTIPGPSIAWQTVIV